MEVGGFFDYFLFFDVNVWVLFVVLVVGIFWGFCVGWVLDFGGMVVWLLCSDGVVVVVFCYWFVF